MKKEPLSTQQIDEYLAHSANNGTEILRSRQAGCFFCESLFSAKEIHDWDNESNSLTAVCPRCGMHSVVGDASGLPLDEENQVIGYEFIHLGKMMEMIKNGEDPKEAIEKAKGHYGRFDEAVKYIDPRKE